MRRATECGRIFLETHWISLLILSFAAAASQAQAMGKSQTDETYVLRRNAQEVVLYCTVLDHQGHLVTDLQQSAFQLSEDRSPVPITHFNHRDVPVSLALVIDASASMKEKRAAVGSAALDLVRASNTEDETSVTNFSDSAYLDQDLTGDAIPLQHALERSETLSGGTALYDTIISTANHLSAFSHRSKQVIVVVTDGRDNASVAALPDVIHHVQATNGPVIYSIGLLYDTPGGESRRARHDLEALSAETGGLAFFPKSAKEVDAVAAEVARDIRNQYTVAYRPPDDTASAGRDGYRTISVQARTADSSQLSVRTRKGYLRVSAPVSVQ